MRSRFLCACTIGLIGLASGQNNAKAKAPAPTKENLQLRGDRFKPLTYDQMTPEQKAVMDKVLSGEIEGGLGAPLNVLLSPPDVAEGIARYGAYVRFHSTVPPKLVELAALITTRHWTSQFPWQAHHRAATQAGLSESTITAIAEGRRPTGMQKDEEAVYNFVA